MVEALQPAQWMVGAGEVVDHGVIALSVKTSTATMTFDGLKLEVRFEDFEASEKTAHFKIESDTTASVTFRGKAARAPLGFELTEFGTTDEGMSLSLTLVVTEIAGNNGVNRQIAYTLARTR